MANAEKSAEKFHDILYREGQLRGRDAPTVAMIRTVSGMKETITFYGIDDPIPPEVEAAIRAEVIPLLDAEKFDGFELDVSVSTQVLGGQLRAHQKIRALQ